MTVLNLIEENMHKCVGAFHDDLSETRKSPLRASYSCFRQDLQKRCIHLVPLDYPRAIRGRVAVAFQMHAELAVGLHLRASATHFHRRVRRSDTSKDSRFLEIRRSRGATRRRSVALFGVHYDCSSLCFAKVRRSHQNVIRWLET